MLYIASDEEEGNVPTEMGEKEPWQVSCSLLAMAEASSRAPKGRNLSLARKEQGQMERLPATLAKEKSSSCPKRDSETLAQNQK